MQQTNTTYTNKELVDLLQGLYSVQQLKGIKFALAVAKNIRTIRVELEDIEKAAKPTPDFMELSQKVAQFEKDKNTEEIKKLEKKNKKLVDQRKKQLAELEELMQDTTEIKLTMIEEAFLPEDITANQVNAIYQIIR